MSWAVLLLVITLSSRAADTKPSPGAAPDPWAPLGPAPADPPSSVALKKAVKFDPGDHRREVALNAPAGYHDMKLKNGGIIRVRDQGKTTLDLGGSNGEPYDPTNANFNRTSSYANKDFSTANPSVSRTNNAAESSKKSFSTSAFGTSSYNDGDRPFQTTAYRGTENSKNNFNKSYALPNSADYTKSFATKSSDLQAKSSNITKSTSSDPFAKPWSEGDKRFFDPTTLHVPHKKFSVTQSLRSDPNSDTITDVPNRPLSVDEVRDLINHGQVPDLNSKPGEPSKALNDPNWEPPLKLPEISDRAAPATPPPDEARDNELPSPGTMAQPPRAATRR